MATCSEACRQAEEEQQPTLAQVDFAKMLGRLLAEKWLQKHRLQPEHGAQQDAGRQSRGAD